MDYTYVLSKTDHTVLKPGTTWEDVKEAIDDGIRFGVASICVPPYFVAPAAEYASGLVKISTVIGFPNGYTTMLVKALEASDAARNGATELDMVLNIGLIKEGNWEAVEEEIKAVHLTAMGVTLKVIVEACLLTEEEKLKVCEILSKEKVDYLKTSTGFSTGGATIPDVLMFKETLTDGVKIKAAGGIKTFAEASRFLQLGADRIGSSQLVKLAKEM